ncbi:MAG: tellurite resistance TerB family protein [Pseudomonadota bacterium]
MQQAQQLLDQFLGQGGSQPAKQDNQADTGAGFNLNSMLSGPGGLVTGAAAGGLAGLLLGGKKPKKIAKTALQVGGAALVGGLAYKAWQNWKSNKPAQSTGEVQYEAPPADTAFLPASQTEQADLSTALIRAMISAAKADGHITPKERQRIGEQLSALNLGANETAFIQEELERPLNIDAVAELAKSPEQAAEIYAASLLAIDPEGAAERAYLALLAARLKLEPGLVEHLHASADAPLAAEPA